MRLWIILAVFATGALIAPCLAADNSQQAPMKDCGAQAAGATGSAQEKSSAFITLPVAGGVVGAIGAIAAAVIAQIIVLNRNSRSRKSDAAGRMYEQFNSIEMLRIRNNVHSSLIQKGNWFLALPKEDISNPLEYYIHKPRVYMNKETAMELYHVLQFFQRVDAFRANKLLYNQLLGKLFGEVFVYWNVVHFQREPIAVSRTNWESAKALHALDTWLESRFPENYKEWRKIADHAKEELFT